MKSFVNYHCHRMYTNVRISDSAVTQRAYAERAKELGHKVISSCEHGWQGNYYETVKIAREYGLKPLISAEAYWVKDRTEKDTSNCHIFIGARNENGRRALNDVLSEANLTGFYRQPRLDIPLILSLPKDDVIVTTACIAYWKYEDIEHITKQFAEHFGKNFFLEVQYHNTDSQRALNKKILDLHYKYNIPIIMGCDSHYITPDQGQNRTDFLKSKGIEYPDEEGWYLDYPDYDTAYERFAQQCVLSHEEIIEAMDNTNVFLDIEDYDNHIFDSTIKMPSLYPDWTQEQKNDEYKRLVWDGWEKYKAFVPEKQWAHYVSEINREIQTVVDTGMADYFIDNYYIIRQGKKNGGWLTKSGRGSAVSFITNMLLGFTDVDRIDAKIHMYPERFMSTTRILQSGSLPDIDFNVAPVEPFAKAQKEVLGEDHAYPMIAYGTMQNSAAWKLYAKSQGVEFEIANAVSTQIKRYENAVKHAAEDEKDTINVLDYIDKEFHEIYLKSKDYLKLVTSWSIAPCSYLLYGGSIRKEIGLVRVKDHICCIMDGHWTEDCHFLKNDLLKVAVVDLIYQAYHRIGQEPPSVKELLSKCTPDDKVWEIYSKGCTLGINQCEQTGTAQRVAKYKPTNISELGAFVAAIRPGFKSLYKQFESRENFSFNVNSFDNIIMTEEMPNSFLLYQEQIMAALSFAGIPMDEGYTVIKSISKKRINKILSYKATFVDGFTKRIINAEDISQEEAQKIAAQIWQVIEDAASYSFNASHAYCVALDSLYGAWLKAHYPLEFYEVLLNLAETKGDKDRMLALKEEAEDFFGIKFPPFKFGQDNRRIKADAGNNTIVNSLGSIKGFGVGISRIFYECSQQNLQYFFDVLQWLDGKGVKAAKIRPLITIDYFRQYGNITSLLKMLDVWDLFKQGTAKMIRKDKIELPVVGDILARICESTNKDGTSSASYKVGDKAFECMYAFEHYTRQHPYAYPTIKERIAYSLDILGYVDVATNLEEDRRRLFITDATPLYTQMGAVWGYRVGTHSLGSGKNARVTIKINQYDKAPVKVGDVIYASSLYKNSGGYWYLMDYTVEK